MQQIALYNKNNFDLQPSNTLDIQIFSYCYNNLSSIFSELSLHSNFYPADSKSTLLQLSNDAIYVIFENDISGK